MAITVPNSVVAATNAANIAAPWNTESPESRNGFAAALGSSDAGPVSIPTTTSEPFMLLPYPEAVPRFGADALDAVSQLGFPVGLDSLDGTWRQRAERDRLGHLLPVLKAPIEELHHCNIGFFGRILPQDLPCATRNRPSVCAGLIGEDHVEILRLSPVHMRRGVLEALERRADDLASAVDHARVGPMRLQNIGIFDVANRTRDALHVRCYTFAPLAANPDRPRNRGVGADFLLPLRADLCQIISESEGCPRPVRPMHDGDIHVGQLQTRVELGDGRIVPLLHLPEIDVSDNLAAQNELPRFNPGEIV